MARHSNGKYGSLSGLTAGALARAESHRHGDTRFGSLSGGLIEDIFGHDLSDAQRAGSAAAPKPSGGGGVFSGLTNILDKIAGGASKGLDLYGQYKSGGQPQTNYAPAPGGSASVGPILLIGAVVGAYLLIKRRK